MIGTTHFTNAIVERKRVIEVAAIRLGLPATRSLPPFTDWPADLASVLGRHRYMLKGGNEFDGREIAPLDELGLRDVARDLRRKGITAAAISSVFSPVTSDMEQRAADILAEEVPGIRLSLSHEIGRIGFLERENATIMNACLVDLADAVVSSFRRALQELRIDAPFFISQNDGTLMAPQHVERYPVLTFASGPTNSMRGAALLAGLKEAMVVDIGGTTSDVGMLMHGFPREAAMSVDIGGRAHQFPHARRPRHRTRRRQHRARRGRAHRPRLGRLRTDQPGDGVRRRRPHHHRHCRRRRTAGHRRPLAGEACFEIRDRDRASTRSTAWPTPPSIG